MSRDSAVGLIRAALERKVNVKHVFVDTVGKPEKYQEYLKSLFPQLDITVAKKADSTYPVVSAASICAKVVRDHTLKVWEFRENVNVKEFGSGYPAGKGFHAPFATYLAESPLSDPVTKKFLVSHCDPVFGYPQLVRFSWSTAANALENTAYQVDWEEVDSTEDGTKKTPSITAFFKMGSQKQARKRHQFFTQRCLTNDVDF